MGSLFLPGDSWLHRLPGGLKLGLLAVLGGALMWVHDWRLLMLVLAIVSALLWQTGLSVAMLWSRVRGLFWLLLALMLYTLVVQSAEHAIALGLRVTTLLLAALVVSVSTSISQLMAVVLWLLQPLERLGWVDTQRVALAFGLTLRLIPELSLQWHDIREAQAARGLSANPLTMAVPMLLRTIRRAQEIAEAIDARG
jgi:biotin transport system permease protein